MIAFNLYNGTMTREEGLGQLTRLAERLHVAPSALRVRPHGERGMSLTIAYGPVTLARTCESQPDRHRNFVCLVLWLGELVRNVERGIETLAEATWNDGGQRLLAAAPGALPTPPQINLYRGDKSIDDSLALITRCLERLDREERDLEVTWDEASRAARSRLRLASGAILDKRSEAQPDARTNLAALALWLECRCRHLERGIERDIDRLFAANLLPARSA